MLYVGQVKVEDGMRNVNQWKSANGTFKHDNTLRQWTAIIIF